ncbi:hypothetical protein D3C75_611910 [compost metagenome]
MKALATLLFEGQGPELFELKMADFAPSAPKLAYNQALLDSVFESMESLCSGLMKPDTHLGENARQIEVSDDQTTSFLFR